MNEQEFKQKEKRKILIVGIICLIVIAIVITVSYTYSFFVLEATNTETITGTVAVGNLEMISVNEVTPIKKGSNGNKVGLIPQTDEAILLAIAGQPKAQEIIEKLNLTGTDANQEKCVDQNNNKVCEVYQITVKNSGNKALNIDGMLQLNIGNNIHLKWARITNPDSPGLYPKTDGTYNATYNHYTTKTFTANDPIAAGESKTYYIVVWISETGSSQSDSGTFNGHVVFKESEATTASSTLYKLGIAPNYISEDSTFKTPNFMNTSCSNGCDENTVGVYSLEDDLGTSYYFRGDVENNYFKMGKYDTDVYAKYDSSTGTSSYDTTCTNTETISCTQIAEANDDMFWRIIRLNGDGTIRMIYDGTHKSYQDSSSVINNIGNSAYNINYLDNTYVGYMYGEAGAATYEETHSNLYDSSIKTTIDNWYEKYLKNNYSSFVADAIYCNDRTLYEVAGGTGIATNNPTYYAFYGRGLSMNGTTYEGNASPKCQRTNDRLTTENATFELLESTETAQSLTNPIALITADEVEMAGSSLVRTWGENPDYSYNKNYYLYNNQVIFTMTPLVYTTNSKELTSSFMSSIGQHGNIGQENVGKPLPVRPVISVRADKTFNGSGTINDPFTISQ